MTTRSPTLEDARAALQDENRRQDGEERRTMLRAAGWSAGAISPYGKTQHLAGLVDAYREQSDPKTHGLVPGEYSDRKSGRKRRRQRVVRFDRYAFFR